MKHSISQDRKTLTICATESERQELRELGDEIGSNQSLWDAFESLVCNSDLEWIDPSETGDLTDAPMLGIIDYTPRNKLQDEWLEKRVLERWAFMSYQVRSPLEDLRDKGEVVFTC